MPFDVVARRAALLCLTLALSAFASRASSAQDALHRGGGATALDREISLGELQPTPEMWFYQQQMKNYLDPKLAVRRNAEFRAAQRQHRLASSQWFGQSKARPTASGTPFTDSYSSSWVSNTANPYNWSGIGNRMVVIRPARPNVTNFELW